MKGVYDGLSVQINNGGIMTKGELRRLRKAGELNDFTLLKPPVKQGVQRKRVASREEQHARYLDCGPGAWDDRDNPDY